MSDPAHVYRQFEDVIRLRPKNDQISVSYISKIEELASELGVDSTSQTYQKIQWELLRSRISYQINRLDVHNIQEVVRELFKLNLQRGRGVLVRSLMKWQLYDTRYAELFASLIAVINSYIPAVGELLCLRLVLQFRKAYLNNNRKVCVASTIFLGYLTNQRVVSEILILQIIQLLMSNPSNDTIAITCEIMKVTGQTLAKTSALALNTIFSKLREMLRDSTQINARTHLNIDIALKAQRNHFKDYPALPKALDLVEEEDQETHTIELHLAHLAHDELNVYQYDPAYQQNEEEYAHLSHEILDNEEDARAEPEASAAEPVIDLTEMDLLQYQKTVYLKVMSSMSADEAVHKLLKMNFGEKGDKNEILADMIVKCCSQEKTYSKYFGVIGEKLCSTNRHWHDVFVRLFKKYYKLVDLLEINSLRNVGKFFGHLFASDKLAIDQGWDEIKITEADTTSAGRILLKFIFQEMVEELGIKEVTDRLIHDNYVKKSINGVFPVVDVAAKDADNIRFSINFFTAIGLGVLTEEMRSVLANLPEERGRGSDRGSSRSTSRSYSRSSGSYSRSRSSSRSRSYSRSRSRSYSRSRSNSRSRSGSETGNRSPTQTSSRTAPNPEH